MRLIDYNFDVGSRSNSLNTWGLGDFHVGTKACYEALLQKNVDKIKNDKRAIVFGTGDYAEFINYTDPRFDSRNIADWISLEDLGNLAIIQCNRVVNILLPIAGKIVGLAGGNHESKIYQKYHFDPLEYIVTRLRDLGKTNIKNLGYGVSICRLKINRGKGHSRTLLVNVFHGSTGSTTVGGALNRVIKASNNVTSDLYLRGHTHQLNFLQQARMHIPISGELKVEDRPQYLVQCGSYLRAYSDETEGYAEIKEYSPSILGSPEVQITVKDNIHYNINLHTS